MKVYQLDTDHCWTSIGSLAVKIVSCGKLGLSVAKLCVCLPVASMYMFMYKVAHGSLPLSSKH